MPTLNERRNQQTRSEIAKAAVELFVAEGFAETTMGDVAMAAGVSRRTVYRHFPTKDDLVFEHPREWLAHFDIALERQDQGDPMRARCRAGLLEVAALIQHTRNEVLAAYSVVVATPSLRGSDGRSGDDWFQRYIALLMPATPPGADATQPVAVIAGTLVGVTRTLVAIWASNQPAADMVAMTRAALDQVDSIWPDWLR